MIIFSLSENMDDRVAFSFLKETKKEILKEYSVDELLNTNSSQLNKGKEILKKKMKYYNAKPITTTNGEFIENLNLAKSAVMENIENLLERNNKIDMIIEKSSALNDSSYITYDFAQKIKMKAESERKNKYIIFIISLVVIILIVLYIFAF